MFKLQPFFSPDDSAASSSDWGSFISSIQTTDDPADADEGQPETDPDAKGEEGTDTAEGQDAVEPNPDEAKTEEPGDDPAADPADKPVFDDETEVDLGEGRQPVKLMELKQGYLRQSDYTKKTQALADDRKAFESEREQLQPVVKLNEFLQNNPFVNQKIIEAVNTFLNTGALPIEEALADAEYGQYINHLMAENNRLRKELDSKSGELDGIKFTTSMDKTITELKTEYGDLVTSDYEQELRTQAKENNYSSDVIKRIAKGDLAEKKLAQTASKTKNVVKETEAKTIQQLQEQRQSLPPQPRSNGQRPADEAPDIANMDWLDLAKHAASKK